MHDEEVGVVNVQADGLEQILDCLLLGAVTIDKVFGGTAEDNLSGDADGGIFLEADRGFLFIPVVEDNGYTSFCYSSLTALVDEILESRWLSAQETRAQEFGCSRTCKFCARTVDMFVIPKTKQMESKMLDLPLPFRPVMELKLSSLRQLATKYSLRFVVAWVVYTILI